MKPDRNLQMKPLRDVNLKETRNPKWNPNYFVLFSPVCDLHETLKTLGEIQRNPKEFPAKKLKKP